LGNTNRIEDVPFPENFELEAFFECEPEVLTDQAPWEFNELTFNAKSDNGTLNVNMITGSERVHIKWTQGENVVCQLDLWGVKDYKVLDKAKYDTLIMSFRNSEVQDLVIKIRPVISIVWGYNNRY